MSEVFDFSKTLRKIVAPELKALGFSQKGARFTRLRDVVTDEIEFQRSQWNDSTSGDALKFFLNLKTGTGKEPWQLTDIRILNPERKPFPEWWLQLTPEERKEKRGGLSPNEMRPIEEAVTSAEWLYSSEEELRSILGVALKEIVERGVPYLEQVSGLLEHADRKRLIAELKKPFSITGY